MVFEKIVFEKMEEDIPLIPVDFIRVIGKMPKGKLESIFVSELKKHIPILLTALNDFDAWKSNSILIEKDIKEAKEFLLNIR